MCGVVGVYTHDNLSNAAELAVNSILRLQHRGQDAAGLTVLAEGGSFQSLKGLGLIQNVLSKWSDLPESHGAIAHTRYATTGKGGVAEIQPFVEGLPQIALAHNGQIVNGVELCKKYGIEPKSTSDLEIIQQLFLRLLQKNQMDWSLALNELLHELEGSCAAVGLDNEGNLFAFRDIHGIRPLFVGRNKFMTLVSSETSAMSLWNDLEIEEIPAGSWIRVFPEGRIEKGKAQSLPQERFCMFELVYFASPHSEFRKKSVYRFRFQLGIELAREIKESLRYQTAQENFDYVVPVPETSRTAAIAIAEELGIPYREYLVKNAYVSRTFILSKQSQRIQALKAKLSLVGPEIKGKRILLVDDSVVRGNTSRLMADRLREVGAASVAMASTCPPIRQGCFYGIDFPDQEELVAFNREIPEVREQLGIKDLFYISEKGLKKALESEELCTSCLSGAYPVGQAHFDQFLEQRRKDRL